MKEEILNIKSTENNDIDTYIVYPDKDGPFPIVLLLMDAPGIRQELYDMASRIASCGYYVLLPNLYYRTSKKFKWNKPNLDFIHGHTPEESRSLMFENMDTLSNSIVLQDIKDILLFCKEDMNADKGPVGIVGYCMSGPFAFYAAAKLNERVLAAASIHGVKLITSEEDSPHLFANDIKGEVYFGCAEKDSYAPIEMIKKLEDFMSKTKVRHEIEVFPGTGHGFAFPNRGLLYSRKDAETHWYRILSLFNRNLKA